MNDNSINKLQTFYDKWQGKDSNGATVIYLDASGINEDSYILGNLGIRKSDPSYAIDVSGNINSDGVYISGTRRDEQWNEAYNLSQAFKETNEPTGFTSPDSVIVTYNPTARTVTLSGTVEAYYNGELVQTLSAGYVSPAHDTNPTSSLFLKYNASGVSWSTIPWDFNELQIADICFKSDGTFCFGQKECHGLMQWQTHKEFHHTIGTYRYSGGDFSNVTIGSTTLKLPQISETIIYDEDLKSTLSALSTATYSQINLSGTTTINLISGTQIVPVSTNRPYYNSWTGSAFTQTLMDNNNYMSIWVLALPSTSDALSQSRRYLFLQGQTQGSLVSQQALNPQDLTLGDLSSISPEFIFIEQIIIQYTSANWSITELRRLTGNKFLQTGSPSGIFLSQVTRLNDTLLGGGTVASPLYVNPNLNLTSLSASGDISGSNFKYNNTNYVAIGSSRVDLVGAGNGLYWDGVDLYPSTNNARSLGKSGNAFDLIHIGTGTSVISGSLGIGTLLPVEKLTVSGGDISIDNGTDTRLLMKNSGVSIGQLQAYNNEMRIQGLTNNSLVLFTNGSARATILSGGNIGIGTTTPDSLTHIHNGSAGTVSAYTNSVLTLENSTTCFLQILSPNTVSQGLLFGDPENNIIGQMYYNHATNAMGFVTSGSERIRITDTGKIGFGTITPSVQYDFSNVTAFTEVITGGGFGTMMIRSTSNTPSITGKGTLDLEQSGESAAIDKGCSITFSNNKWNFGRSYTLVGGAIKVGKENGTNQDASSYMAISIADNVSLNEVIRISSTGKTGFGVAVPSSKLDVAGDIEISGTGSMYFGDPTTDGSGRLRYNNATQVFYFEKRASGSWVVA